MEKVKQNVGKLRFKLDLSKGRLAQLASVTIKQIENLERGGFSNSVAEGRIRLCLENIMARKERKKETISPIARKAMFLLSSEETTYILEEHKKIQQGKEDKGSYVDLDYLENIIDNKLEYL